MPKAFFNHHLKIHKLSQERIFLVGLVIVMWLLDWIGLSRSWETPIGRLAQPVQFRSYQIVRAVIFPFEAARDSFRAARRIQDLELRYAESQARLTELEALQVENQLLKSLLENSDRSLKPSVIVTPLVSLADPAIGAGQQAGIQSGQLVLVGKTLVGVVAAVGPYQSEVQLLSNRDGPLVVARTESGVEGLVRGDGKRVLLTEVPLDQVLNVGEKVISVGQIGVPGQVFIGQIQSVKKDPAAASQVAVIDQLVSFFQTPLVEVQSL